MSNHSIGHGKTMFDLFNMINPNCYQAFIIQCIIENNKEEALQYCHELSTAIEHYKWDSSGKQSDYIDQLVCESNLQKWQKIAIIHIIANDVESCKSVIESEINNDLYEDRMRLESVKQYINHNRSSLEDLYNTFGFKPIK